MIQLSNDYVLGYVWCTGTKRHSTIMQHFQCAYAAVISGEWHYDMPVSQKKPYEKKRKAGLIHFGGDRPVSSTIPRQQRGGKSMMMQLMFNEFRKAIFDKQCDRFLQYWDYRPLFGIKEQLCKYVRKYPRPGEPSVWYPLQTPIRIHPRLEYPVHLVWTTFAKNGKWPDVNYVRPNLKKPRHS